MEGGTHTWVSNGSAGGRASGRRRRARTDRCCAERMRASAGRATRARRTPRADRGTRETRGHRISSSKGSSVITFDVITNTS